MECGLRAEEFKEAIRPILEQNCFTCHSKEKHKGDLDLEQFVSRDDVLKRTETWEKVIEQLSRGEMPPEEEKQPTPEERSRLIRWVNETLETFAKANAGDPGPVLLRRLSNAEYTYTIRDLTGLDSLDPAKEFPADSASGEGFMNVGNSLVMSSSLLTKYFDAAKGVANHMVLMPDRISFSAGVSQNEWAEERVAAIRKFYAQFTVPGRPRRMNIQGLNFVAHESGALPLEEFFEATLSKRQALSDGTASIAPVAKEKRINEKYLALLWSALNGREDSMVLDHVRAEWQKSKPGDGARLADVVGQWQRVLWRFQSVGHIGRKGGPTAWQSPLMPVTTSNEFRIPLRPSPKAEESVLYLVTTDAGDGAGGDNAVWENPRLTAPGRTDIPLRDLRRIFSEASLHRETVFKSTAACLAAASEFSMRSNGDTPEQLAKKFRVEKSALDSWFECLGVGGVTHSENFILTQRIDRVENHDFVKGFGGKGGLKVLANSSDQGVRIPGDMRAHSVAVHPSSVSRVVVGWRSPVQTVVQLSGQVRHAQPECGNGVTWTLEFRRGNLRQRFAYGVAMNGALGRVPSMQGIAVQPGDMITLAVGSRNGDYACDLTDIELELSDAAHKWSLAADVSPDILAGNPHADSFGNASVWQFFSEPDLDSHMEGSLPEGSLFGKWLTSPSAKERQRFAKELQELLTSRASGVERTSPDAALYRQLASLSGPLLNSFLNRTNLALPGTPGSETEIRSREAASKWGLAPEGFENLSGDDGKTGNGIFVSAPSVIEVRLPADLVRNSEFVVSGKLNEKTGTEGSVQMRVMESAPTTTTGLVPIGLKGQPDKVSWAEADKPVVFEAPIFVSEGSAAMKRVQSACDEFRRIFPAALCYSQIVPVDEAATVILFHREDEHLSRLLLDEKQGRELDRLWDELHFVSQDALKSVDAFDQFLQYATQDADTNVFMPMQEPIRKRAQEFRKRLVDTEPTQLNALMDFAEKAYRRPLSTVERGELENLYRNARDTGTSHENAMRLALSRVLISPGFLYRAERPSPGRKPGPVNDWELATRLSYFLWSSSPDAELCELARQSKLREPDILVSQTRRMMKSPRIRRLATEFGCAWLHIHDFDSFDEKSERHFPTFQSLRGLMYEEAIRYFTDVFQNNASVLTLYDSDHTFLNQPLAEHYGIPGVTGPEWRRVEGVKRFGRGGVLGMGATLSKQSGASRTSPILRGSWISEVLLGEKLPRPPKNVPRLPEEEAAGQLTVRELTVKHTADPLCAKCHVRIDGFGFTLEAFDAIGRRRAQDLGGRPIDARGKVFDGTELDGADALRHYLTTTKRDELLNQFCRKLLGYALGRSVILTDRPLLAKMRTQLEKNEHRIGAAVEEIVLSEQFRNIRGAEASNN